MMGSPGSETTRRFVSGKSIAEAASSRRLDTASDRRRLRHRQKHGFRFFTVPQPRTYIGIGTTDGALRQLPRSAGFDIPMVNGKASYAHPSHGTVTVKSAEVVTPFTVAWTVNTPELAGVV